MKAEGRLLHSKHSLVLFLIFLLPKGVVGTRWPKGGQETQEAGNLYA